MTATSYEKFFTALSGNRRLDILQYLQVSGPQNVTDIATGTGIEQSAVSHNIAKLLSCEFVHIEVRGKHRYYSLNEDTIVPLLKLIDEHISAFCTGSCDCCVTSSAKSSDKGGPITAGDQKQTI